MAFLLFLPDRENPECVMECDSPQDIAREFGALIEGLDDDDDVYGPRELVLRFPHSRFQPPLPGLGLEVPSSPSGLEPGVWYFQETRWIMEWAGLFLQAPFGRWGYSDKEGICRLREVELYKVGTVP